jgi:DNA-binding beta-propeller fold protein YncE
VTGNGNGRVEVFKLNEDGTLAHPTADHILGKPSEYARRSHANHWSQSETEFPGSVGVDHVNQRLFVVDNATGAGYPDAGSQIMVFDIHPNRIRTGASVIAVLGQPDADSKTIGLAANHVGRGPAVAVDDANQRLFVGDGRNNRVLVFDIRPEVFETGMDAAIVLGQMDFTSGEPGVGPSKFTRPGSVAYDATNQRLFVADVGNSRVLVFDASPEALVTGASAIDVMGQPDLTTNERHSGLDEFATGGLSYDDKTGRLFIAESHSRIEHMRITLYDVSLGTPLGDVEPIAVLGKPGFGAYDPIVSREQSVWPRLGASSLDSERQLLVATEGFPGGNRALIWDISPENLRNGAPAVEVVGHLDDDMNPDFNRRSANDRVNARNVYPRDVALDAVDHRLFAIDQYNNRVLAWQLDSQNRILDRDARWVFGQPHMYTAGLRPVDASTLKIPLALAYDPSNKRVFVSDGWGNRVMVFDAHPDRIKSGADAIAALGQPDFTTTTPSRTRNGIDFDTRVGTGITPARPRGTGITYDPVNDRVFVSDGGNHRVLVYDVGPGQLRTGMSASLVIGQPDFTSGERGLDATGLSQPAALRYDSEHHRLFVADGGNNRVLVFDARPQVLNDGAAAITVIGQPDLTTSTPLRTRSGIDGPDGLAYDYRNDRLLVSDHGNDRVTIYDAAPLRLANMPDALYVIGQKDFTTRELGPVRANELWDPRGLAFDSEHQRLYISQGFAANIMIHDMARPVYEFDFFPNVVQSYQSSGADTYSTTNSGYAVASGGDALAGGTAVFTIMTTTFDDASQRESRMLVSETGFAAPPQVEEATVFVDGRPDTETFIVVANPRAAPTELRFVHHGTDGSTLAQSVTRELDADGSMSVRVSALFPGAVTGSVTVRSDESFALTAARLTSNDRQEDILTAVPVAYETAAERPSSLTIPRVEMGGGYTTQLVLLNPTDRTLEGIIKFLTVTGEPLRVEGTATEMGYSIAPNGTFVWESPQGGNVVESGFAVVSAATEVPVGTAIVSLERGETLITEAGMGGGAVGEAWFGIDTYPSVVRHGRMEFRVTLANGGARPADVRLIVYTPDGEELTRTHQILPAGHRVEFTQVDLADRGRFKGSVRIVSDVPISMAAHRRTTNIRNELIVARLPSLTLGSGTGRLIFPRFLDGPEVATELFMLSKGTALGGGRVEFFDERGQPLTVVLR